MRTFLLSLIIGAIVCLFIGLVAFSPYHFTSVAINDGISTPFLNLDKLPRSFVFNNNYLWHEDTAETKGDSLWDEINFGNVRFELPLRHPLYLMSPTIEIDQKTERFGLTYFDHQRRVLLSFMMTTSMEWQTERGLDKIFSLPIFVNHLQTIGRERIWRDIFTRQVADPLDDVSGFSDLSRLSEHSYEEMLYDIYILSLRKRYFPPQVKAFRIEKDNTAWIELEQNEDNESRLFREEWALVSRLGRVHRFVFKTRRNSAPASVLRSHMTQSFRFDPSDPDRTKILHAQFQNLSLRDKVDQEGLTLLYSAWSHSPDQKEFLREMIQYSERGQKNEGLIGALYNYAFKKYGTNFSNISENLLETASERLKRRIKEDEKRELEEFKKSKSYIPDEFGSEDERVEFFLNRAREDENSGQRKGVLEVP